MDIGRVASLFIHGVEAYLHGNAIRLSLVFRAPIDRGRLTRAFSQLIATTPALRQRFEPGGWTPMRVEDVQAAVIEQAARLAADVDAKAAYSEYHPTNQGLPVRLAIVAPCRLVLSLNHAVGNGKAAFAHLERLLRAYDGTEPEPERADLSTEPPEPPAGPGRTAAGVAGAALYLLAFLGRAGFRSARTTVDLSRARRPAPTADGYAVWTYAFDEEDTKRVIAGARAAGLTVTERLCEAMAEVLLESQPDKSRVCLLVPTDITARAGTRAGQTPGNFTGSLIVQVYRNSNGASLASQVRRGFRWTAWGVHYWVPWLVGQAARQEARLAAHFLALARRPIPERAPFENYSCAVSSVGVIAGPMTERYLATVSAHTRTQAVMVCAITLDGRMTFEACMPQDLYDCAEVATVTDTVVERLAGLPAARAAGLRHALYGDERR